MAARYLLDTCVISEMVAKAPNRDVMRLVDSLDPDIAYLSVLTIGEIQRGVERLPASRKKQRLARWLEEDLLVRFSGQIAGIDLLVMLAWGRMMARLEALGRILPMVDSLIAATALAGDFTLATRNEQDFDGTGVRIVNPWA